MILYKKLGGKLKHAKSIALSNQQLLYTKYVETHIYQSIYTNILQNAYFIWSGVKKYLIILMC